MKEAKMSTIQEATSKLADRQKLTHGGDEPHLGKWLVQHLAGIGEIELPPREEGRPSPFADWTDEDLKD